MSGRQYQILLSRIIDIKLVAIIWCSSCANDKVGVAIGCCQADMSQRSLSWAAENRKRDRGSGDFDKACDRKLRLNFRQARW
ncbi:MAG: hypothetical protein ACBR18_01765 [Microcoleus sp.]